MYAEVPLRVAYHRQQHPHLPRALPRHADRRRDHGLIRGRLDRRPQLLQQTGAEYDVPDQDAAQSEQHAEQCSNHYPPWYARRPLATPGRLLISATSGNYKQKRAGIDIVIC